MSFFNRKRTSSQTNEAANTLKEIIENEENNNNLNNDINNISSNNDTILNNNSLLIPSSLEIYCKSMLGIDVNIIINEDDSLKNIDNTHDSLFTTIKNTMLKQAGGKEDVTFLGECDPFCNLIKSLNIKSFGTSTKLQFIHFPIPICFLKNLQSLSLSNHLFSSIPSLNNLLKLQFLTIEYTKLKSLSEIGNNCINLLHLDLNNNKLTSISKNIQNLIHLVYLNVNNNQIKDIGNDISILKDLEVLDISYNRISKLNNDLKYLIKLKSFILSNNNLGSGLRNRNPLIPLSSMISLTHIDLSNNKLSCIPSFDLLQDLIYLNISNNLLSEFPILYKSTKLEQLLLSHNQISNIPINSLSGLSNLLSLDLSYNQIKFIPSSIEVLISLNELNISYNNISTLPDALSKLINLIQLNISYNHLMVIQNGIFISLNNIKTCNLSNNRLSRLPDDFFTMLQVQEIDLSVNSLQDLPKLLTITDTQQLSYKLTKLFLNNNQLVSLPDYICKFPITTLELYDNPINSLPLEFPNINSLIYISIYNISIDNNIKSVKVLSQLITNSNNNNIQSNLSNQSNQSNQTTSSSKNKKDKDDEIINLAAIEHLLILSRNCPHPLFIYGLAELASEKIYHNALTIHLEVFLLLLSSTNVSVAINSIRALSNLALHSKGRITMFESPLLFQTLLVLSNREDSTLIPVAVEALNTIAHLCLYDKVAALILKQGIDSFIEREKNHKNNKIREGCRQILANIGYTGHLNKRLSHLKHERGIRILCMDGGGTKSVSTVLILHAIEQQTGKKIHQLFDLICGTSVGGILACLFGIACLNAIEVQILQKKFFREIFTSGAKKSEGFAEKVALLSNLFSTGGRYNTPVFEQILRDIFKEDSLVDSSSREDVTKVFVASMHMDTYPPSPYLFRNYTYPPGIKSRYPGTCERKVWEGIRATSAAPSMFTECVYDGMRFSDGGMAVNNPTGLGYHEFLKIWGKDTKLDCVLSIGTGAPVVKQQTKSIKDFVLSVIESATSVARVDDIMEDFLDNNIYYRFNVIDDAFDVILDETRDEKIKAMEDASLKYVEQNSEKLSQLTKVLLSPSKDDSD